MKTKQLLLSIIILTFAMAGLGGINALNAQERDGRSRPMTFTNPDMHDPVMALGEDGRYYIFATGMGVTVMSSSDMEEWRFEKPVLAQAPQWAMDSVPGYRGHTWAPDIIYHNGLWHLYYSCSTFGKNGSAIGHAVNKTLDPTSPNFKWEDKGVVIVSHRNIDNWNAIDPNIIIDKRGLPYMTYGSFWDGIQLVQLSEQDMQTPITKPVTIARRLGKAVELDKIKFTKEPAGTIEAGENAIEAPFIVKRGKYYYLFVSFDYCCRGENSTYKTVYGRSKKITGPFLDKEGRPMEYGGGTYLYGPDESNFGIGHCSVYEINGEYYFISHAYLKEFNGRSKLFIRKLQFDKKGWIIAQ